MKTKKIPEGCEMEFEDKNKEKQIEEMARLICPLSSVTESCAQCRMKYESTFWGCSQLNAAKRIYDANYRKVVRDGENNA